MSYTILTIPFNLKEKVEGDFLKKGFVFDDVYDDYFKDSNISSSCFLKVIEFDEPYIKNIITRKIFKKMGVDPMFLKFNKDEVSTFKENASFIANVKYLPSISDYIDLSEIKSNKTLSNKTKVKSDICNLTDSFMNELKFFALVDSKCLEFKIKSIKLLVNKQKSNNSVGFGFLSINLEWINKFENPEVFAKDLASVADFYRWYNNSVDSKTLLYHDTCYQSKWNKKIEKKKGEISFDLSEYKISEDKLDEKLEGPISNKDSQARNTEEIPLTKNALFTHEIVEELLQSFLEDSNYQHVYDFNNNLKIKPFLLHLFQTKCNLFDNKDVEDYSSFVSNIYNSLRIPDRVNVSLNIESEIDFKAYKPDLFTQIYCINEGAMVIKGNSDEKKKAEMINEFYPAFLFALNQKYLFYYCQKKINSMPLDKNERYDLADLRRLRGMLVKAEFSQVFLAISNYNEIDLFYSKLREKFQVNDLREEYIKSIEGLNTIANLSVEKDNKKQDDRLNTILFVLAIAQVWTGIYELLNFENNWKWYLNLTVYLIFATIIWTLVDIKKLIRN